LVVTACIYYMVIVDSGYINKLTRATTGIVSAHRNTRKMKVRELLDG